jgi:uncharacterized membrane protein
MERNRYSTVVGLFLYSKNMIVFLVSDYLWLFILADKIHSKMGEGTFGQVLDLLG